jgi:hypothetical protein
MLRLSILIWSVICFSQAFGQEAVESNNKKKVVATLNAITAPHQNKEDSRVQSAPKNLATHLSITKTLSNQSISSSGAAANADSITDVNAPTLFGMEQYKNEALLNSISTSEEETTDDVSQRYEYEKKNYLLAAVLISITAIIILGALLYIRFSPLAEFQIAKTLQKVAALTKNVNLNRLKNIWS